MKDASDASFRTRPASLSHCATVLPVRNHLFVMDGAENPIGRDNRIVGPIAAGISGSLSPYRSFRAFFSLFLLTLYHQYGHHRSGDGGSFLKTRLPRRESHREDTRKEERKRERDRLALNSSAVESR